jgi:hypothetical protein
MTLGLKVYNNEYLRYPEKILLIPLQKVLSNYCRESISRNLLKFKVDEGTGRASEIIIRGT